MMGGGRAMKGGIGSVALVTADGLIVGAIVAVNAVGSVIDPRTAKPVAGVRTADGRGLEDPFGLVRRGVLQSGPAREATTIGVVVTNARLTKAQALKAVKMAHDGMARAIVPSHTRPTGHALHDGDWRSHGRVQRRHDRRARAEAVPTRLCVRSGWRAACQVSGRFRIR